jgi:hypothetical protein
MNIPISSELDELKNEILKLMRENEILKQKNVEREAKIKGLLGLIARTDK